MLFKAATLEKIRKGEVTLAFRKWKRPTVKKGGTLITYAGQLQIIDIVPFTIDEIDANHLKAAGIDDVPGFKKKIHKIKDGQLYKISFCVIGPDPRIALRNQNRISDDELLLLEQKLKGMDTRGRYGPWTTKVLNLIRKFPRQRAIKLANEMGVEKNWLKPNIRKLKGLGLTISHKIGYELSPRGKTLLKWITKK